MRSQKIRVQAYDVYCMGRQISQQEGKEMAEKWSCPTIETSAKHNENVGKCPILSFIHVTIECVIYLFHYSQDL